jgi:DNA-binding transcriptional ArsR family regulator
MRTQEVFRALADPTRREILKRLKRGSLNAGELADMFPMTKASMSHHFNVLKAAELVRCERRGKQQVYAINTSVFEEVAASVLGLLSIAKRGTDEVQTQTPAQRGVRRRTVRMSSGPIRHTP